MSDSTRVPSPELPGEFVVLPIAAEAVLREGGLVARDREGRAVRAVDAKGIKVVGRSEDFWDNRNNADGAYRARIKRGVFGFENSANFPVRSEDIGAHCYVQDDATVARTSVHRVVAGRIIGFRHDLRVWVDTRDTSPSAKVSSP